MFKAGVILQVVYNVFYFFLMKVVKATGNAQFSADVDAVFTAFEKLFTDLK